MTQQSKTDATIDLDVYGEGFQPEDVALLIDRLEKELGHRRVKRKFDAEPTTQAILLVCAIIGGLANLPKAISTIRKSATVLSRAGKKMWLVVYSRRIDLALSAKDIISTIRRIQTAKEAQLNSILKWNVDCSNKSRRKTRRLESFFTQI